MWGTQFEGTVNGYLRSDLVAALAEKADTSKTKADAVLSAFSDILIDAVDKGEKVSIPGIVSVGVSRRSHIPQVFHWRNVPDPGRLRRKGERWFADGPNSAS